MFPVYVFFLLILATSRRTASLTCYSCKDVGSLDNCKTVASCGSRQSCYTRVKTIRENVTVSMGCTSNQNCGSIPSYETISAESQAKQCYECCGSDQCNNRLCKHPKPSPCIDDPSVKCAYWNKKFNICEEVHEAKLICRNFCNLCSLVDGNWAEWSTWSGCDAICGNGKHTRYRTCTNPAPAYQGMDCEGASSDIKPCVRPLCQVHGGWTEWSKWGSCSVSCGVGIQKRHRNCTNPYPSRYGDHCFGDSVDVNICLRGTCATKDGGWTNWGKWSSCGKTCGAGLRKRSRTCSNPPPNIYGRFCDGDTIQVEMCNEIPCRCSTPPTVQNGVTKKVTYSKYNTSFYVECNLGYELKGSRIVECSTGEEWNVIPSCVAVNCGVTNIPDNGRIVNTSGNTFQAVILFECHQGYHILGNPSVYCKENGSWSPLPRCEPIGQFTYDTSVEATRLHDVTVQIGDDPSRLDIVARHKTAIGADCTFRFRKPYRGRYLKIQLETTQYLHIAELNINSII